MWSCSDCYAYSDLLEQGYCREGACPLKNTDLISRPCHIISNLSFLSSLFSRSCMPDTLAPDTLPWIHFTFHTSPRKSNFVPPHVFSRSLPAIVLFRSEEWDRLIGERSSCVALLAHSGTSIPVNRLHPFVPVKNSRYSCQIIFVVCFK